MARIEICFVLTIFVALFSLGSLQPAGDYHAFCQKTSYANICIQVIEAFPNANLKKEVHGWLQILNDRSTSFLITTLTQFGNALAKNPDPEQKKRLLVCKDEFETAEFEINGQNLFWPNLNHTNYPDYNHKLGVALLSVEACINVFAPPAQNPAAILTQGTDDAIKLVLEGLNVYQCGKRIACDKAN